ncbi:PREDICTED: aprataxin and PNK-like factor [Rhagoletis zephyria]|uniref:aprataxin and PNK-like factor n=1 Tax=Rhagoletis zephyria TaxID=28612 RepID=UPI000811500C|nr:PREDICTED: aprataxin and PNK-like factor [Rhagoletis zephyria]
MLPVINDIGLDPKNRKLVSAESTSSAISQRINLYDGAHCSTGIKVKDVSEINNCNILGANGEENENRDYLKRVSSCADNDSKRVRLSDDIDASIETYEAEKNTSIFENKNAETSSNSDQERVNGHGGNGLVFEIKSEPLVESNEGGNINDMCQSGSGSTSTIDIKRAVKIEKADACSSSSRESCRFGIRCYRRNPVHRIEEAHPGDNDYKRPNYPPPPKGTPDCPYGSLCYRRNPAHFQHFNHPPETNFEQNYKNYRLRGRQRQHEQDEDALNSSTNGCVLDDDYDLDEPFSNDEEFDSDYLPNSIDEDDDDDYDSCDKVEE